MVGMGLLLEAEVVEELELLYGPDDDEEDSGPLVAVEDEPP